MLNHVETESVGVRAALRYAFDRNWLKNGALAFVFAIIPVAGPVALIGWRAEAFRRLVTGSSQVPALSFSDFSEHFKRGIVVFAVQLVYQTVAVAITTPVMTILFVVQALVRSGVVEPAPLLFGAGGALVFLFFFTVMYAQLFFSVGAQLRVELTGEINEAFQLKQIALFAKTMWKLLLWRMLVFGFFASLLSFVGLLACFVGVLIVGGLLQLAWAHLHWQFGLEYLRRGGTLPHLTPIMALPSEAVPYRAH